jgi:hypothetical protein
MMPQAKENYGYHPNSASSSSGISIAFQHMDTKELARRLPDSNGNIAFQE